MVHVCDNFVVAGVADPEKSGLKNGPVFPGSASPATSLLLSLARRRRGCPTAEVKRRIEDLDSGRVQGVPAEQVFARARKILGR